METKRLVLAIVLCIAVLVLWQVLFVKKTPAPQPTGAETTAQTEQAKPQAPQQKEASQAGVPAKESAPEKIAANLEQVSSEKEERLTVGTSLYQAVWSNKGGVLQSFKLKKHKSDDDGDLEIVPAFVKDTHIYPFSLMDETEAKAGVDIAGISANAYNTSLYKFSGTNLELKDGETGVIRFEFSDGKDISVEKTYTFYGGKYNFDTSVVIRKGGQKVEPRLLWGPGIGNPTAKEKKRSFGGGAGVSVYAANNLFRIDERKYKPEQSAFNFVNWAAYDDNYFAALFLSATENATAVFLKLDKDKASYFYLSVASPRSTFIGPKDYDALVAFGHDTKKIVRFGFLGFIAEILLYGLKFIYRYIPNWGVAIIILTFIIKILFFPLTYSSTKSMAKMAELQPKVKALRAKYKKAKQDIAQRRQMNEEMMALYKEHGVNPAGGCLPMLIQFPVLIGFFNLLRIAIEMRQSPFMLWIKDLSLSDPIYVLPVLMGITQFISQKMTPTSADPQQARMMLIMPVVMTFLFINFQSGLVLYWLTSNVLQIGQQYIMNRMMKKKKMEESYAKRRKK